MIHAIFFGSIKKAPEGCFLVEAIKEFDEEIQRRLVPYEKEFKDIQSVTGIKGISAASTISEIGVEMSRFPDEHHLPSWAAISPGNNESAGKRKSSRTQSLQQLS